MNSFLSASTVAHLFETLQNSNVKYLLLRNIDNELPDRLPSHKDIDVLVHPANILLAHRTLLSAGWKQIHHPWNYGNNFTFLYSMIPFRMYAKGDLHIDITYQLNCRSLNNGEWIPLDQMIQNSAWKNRREEPKTVWLYRLGYEDEAIHLLTRCIFDKRDFATGYKNRLDEILPILDSDELYSRLELVFFKFTSTLLKLLATQQYEKIRDQYIGFKQY